MSPFAEKRFGEPRIAGPEERCQLLEKLREALSRCPEIVFAHLHGSFARGEPFRDLDVGLFTTGAIPGEDGFAYESALRQRLSRVLGLEVDAHDIRGAPVAVQMAVLRDGVLLFCRDRLVLADFVEGVSRRYPENAHFRNLFLGIDGLRR